MVKRIKVAAYGVCHTDLYVIRGEVAFPNPGVLGHEVGGAAVELGPNTDPTPSTRHMPLQCVSGLKWKGVNDLSGVL